MFASVGSTPTLVSILCSSCCSDCTCHRVLDINCISLPELLYVEVHVYDGLSFNILVEVYYIVVLHFGLDTCQIKLVNTKVHRF